MFKLNIFFISLLILISKIAIADEHPESTTFSCNILNHIQILRTVITKFDTFSIDSAMFRCNFHGTFLECDPNFKKLWALGSIGAGASFGAGQACLIQLLAHSAWITQNLKVVVKSAAHATSSGSLRWQPT